jgi:uncharacterized membrane protein
MGQVFTMWDHMRHYPGLLGLYVVGTGAVAGGNLGALSYALRDLRFGDEFMDSTRTAIDPPRSNFFRLLDPPQHHRGWSSISRA